MDREKSELEGGQGNQEPCYGPLIYWRTLVEGYEPAVLRP